jgi:hypothetical protein
MNIEYGMIAVFAEPPRTDDVLEALTHMLEKLSHNRNRRVIFMTDAKGQVESITIQPFAGAYL